MRLSSHAVLPGAYRRLEEQALLDEIRHIDGVISRLPADLEPLIDEAEEARRRLFEAFCRRGAYLRLKRIEPMDGFSGGGSRYLDGGLTYVMNVMDVLRLS